MQYRLLGKSGLRVSEAALGTMTFGEEWGWGSVKDEARKVYDAFREAGGNFIDNLESFNLALSAEQVKALDEASQIDPGFPYHLYAKELVRAIAYGGMRDQILAL